MATVKLVPNDCPEGVSVPVEVALKFHVYKDIAEMYEDPGNLLQMELGEVSKASLEKAIEFATYHLEHPNVVVPPNTEDAYMDWDNLSPWDKATFCGELTDPEAWIPLVACANYLGYEEMVHVTCKRLGFLIADRDIEEIKRIFRVQEADAPAHEPKRVRVN